ncbi:hypothetical protein ncot_11435 [Nocardioides sp. JQ2195]|uniref:hypothetical protein n=1 Tax=Nocardioides sp. JQ2195 TaxID=2592334 RepID=UPI00143E6075|nr:hypothetical protein [Nocardioides sp. JQ2195]QIX27142.1 hypothetical protein ncot_11435 [Nocardioides sp. JQ2195]
MAGNKPLGKIKNVTAGSLKISAAAAGRAIGLAKGTLSTSGHVARSVAAGAAGAVSSLTGRRQATPSEEQSTGTDSATAAPQAEPATYAAQGGSAESGRPEPTAVKEAQPEPVNVTEELGLDPAPVEKPKPKKKPATKPTNRIDAAADPSTMDATPADVAKTIGKDSPGSTPST